MPTSRGMSNPVRYWLINGKVYSGRTYYLAGEQHISPPSVAVELNRAKLAGKPGEPIDAWDALALREMGL